MVHNLSSTNNLVSCWVRELRDVTIQTDSARFRRNMERIGEVAAYEISKLLDYQKVAIETPIMGTVGLEPASQPVLATIMRAGLPLYQGLLNYFDKADSAFIGAYRKHNSDGSFVIDQHYMASPSLNGRPLILADPMLATGASMVLALKSLLEYDQPTQLHIVCAIASKAGILYLENNFPNAHIWVAAIDETLNSSAYIVPGLGDAGDLSFGKKRQQ